MRPLPRCRRGREGDVNGACGCLRMVGACVCDGFFYGVRVFSLERWCLRYYRARQVRDKPVHELERIVEPLLRNALVHPMRVTVAVELAGDCLLYTSPSP